MVVEPIKSKALINKMIKCLEKKNHRDALLFRMGLNTILRISDIITLKYSQLFDSKGRIKTYLKLYEQKTNKSKKIKLNKLIQDEVTKYVKLKNLSNDDYIFYSFKNKDKHIDRTNAWRVLKRAANKVGVQNFGTHSMRKTLAYYIYKSTKNISLVMKMLNHQNPSVTLRYIGVDQDMIDNAYEEYSI
jgi:integrase